MADSTREAAYVIRIEDGPALQELGRIKKALDDQTAVKRDLTKQTKDLIAAETALQKTINDEGAATAQQTAQLRKLQDARADTNRQLAETDAKVKHLSGVYREQINEVSGLTAMGLRFRDKMADANLVALKNAGILGQLDARSASLTAEINTLTAAYQKGAKTEKEYQNEAAKLQKELDATNAKSSTLEKKIEELNLEFKAGKISQEQYKAGLADISKQTEGLGAKFDNFTKGQAGQLKSTLSSVALQYVGVGAAVYGLQKIVGGAIDIVVEFDKKLANVSALGGEYRDNIDALGEAAKNIGPKFGVGAGKALDSVEALAKAGVSASDILGGALEGALTLAASGELDAGQAAEYAASTMVQFGLAGKDVSHIADLLSASANKAQGEVSDFGNALKFVGPVAASMNVSLDETVGTLADFAQNGILGEQAGTSLRGVLSSLTSPSKAATDELKALGVVTEDGASKLFDAQGKFKGLANLAGVLQEATKNLTQEERANALGKIFGNQQLTAANILIKDGEKGIRDFTTAVNDQGIAEQVATDKLNSLKGATDRMTSAWGAFILSIEDGKGAIGGTITALENMFTTILEGLTATGKDKSLDAFSGKVDEILAKSKDFEKVKFYNVSAQKSVKALDAQVKALDQYKTTLGEVQLEEEARAQLAARLADLQSKPFSAQSTIEQAAIQVAIEGYDKVIGKRKEELAQQGEGVKGSAQSAAATLKEAETLATLGDKLKELQDARKAIDITDTKGLAQNKAQIDALQKQIAAIEGTTKATRAQSQEARNAVGSIADYNAQIADLKKLQSQSTTSAQFKTYTVQIDALTEKVQFLTGELVKMPALKDVQFTATGTDTGAIPEPPEIHVLPALLEKARIEELQHIVDFDLQRQILNEQYNEGIIKSKEELAARLADIDKAQQDLALADQTAALSAAQNLASSIQGVINEAFDNRIANIDDQQQALQDRLQSASDAQTKQEIQGQIDRLAAQKKGLDAQKKAMQAFAVAAALIDTYASANAAYRSQLTIPTPDAPVRAAVAAAAAIIAGLLNVAKISGFAKGGTVPEDRGYVTSAWGNPIYRSNGDNVMVTLKRGEVVLNESQQDKVKRKTGMHVGSLAGIPGHQERQLEIMRNFRTTFAYAGGGTVGLSLPRPDPASIVNNQLVVDIGKLAQMPLFVRVTEINDVQGRVATITQQGTA
jgi:TP901 family phage tail tape measure protein